MGLLVAFGMTEQSFGQGGINQKFYFDGNLLRSRHQELHREILWRRFRRSDQWDLKPNCQLKHIEIRTLFFLQSNTVLGGRPRPVCGKMRLTCRGGRRHSCLQASSILQYYSTFDAPACRNAMPFDIFDKIDSLTSRFEYCLFYFVFLVRTFVWTTRW